MTHDPIRNATPVTVVNRPGSTWSQDELGEAFDIGTVSLIGELDPTGVKGVLEEVLTMFQESLGPVLSELEHLRAIGSSAGIRFEAHKLKSAAGQLGALRLSAACEAIMKHFETGPPTQAEQLEGELDTLVDDLMRETVRVQRKLRRLLDG